MARVALKSARVKNQGRADEAFKRVRMEDGGVEIARLDLYGIYVEIRDEDVAGPQSALRSHGRINADVALMEFVLPSREQP